MKTTNQPTPDPSQEGNHQRRASATRTPLLGGAGGGFGLLLGAFLSLASLATAATNDLSSALQTGLFEEEANRNLPAAIAAYEKVAKQFDQNRALAATAIFRLGEVNRKLGKTNEAAAFYQRILREFTDQDTLAKLSQQNLAGMGALPRTAPASSESFDASIVAFNAAEAEVVAFETEIKQLGNLGREDRLKVVQLNYSNPILTKLLEDLATAQQQQVTLLRDYSSDHPNVKASHSLIVQINKQIDDQLSGVLIALAAKRNLAVARVETLRKRAEKNPRFFPPPNSAGSSAPITAVLDEEETEIRRIQAMIQNSPDLINAPSGEDGTPLYRAASKGQLRVAAFLLDHGADVDTRAGVSGKTYGDWTPLYAAANQGHRAMVELLAARGANVNATVERNFGSGGKAALHRAVEKGFQAVAEALLAKGADVNARTKSGETPLHLAANRGHPALTAFLLTKGADVNAASEDGGTPLMSAAWSGHSDTLKKLLTAKASINAEDNKGRTALSYAAEGGHLDCVTALLAAKADPSAGKVNLPLHCAVMSKSTGIVEALLKAGADANRESTVYWLMNGERKTYGSAVSPLALAVTAPQLDVIKLLLAHKADPNGKQVDGVPLIFSVVNDAEMMKAFLDAGAKPNVDDGTVHRRSPLTMTSDPKIISLLLAAGANPETRHRQICDNSELGLTPLQIQAVCGGKPVPAAEALLKGGANVNARTSVGLTALHFAAANKNKELMELLLAYKADVNARDDQGLTPLDYAEGKAQSTASGSGTLRLSAQQPIQSSVTLSGSTSPHSETSNVAELLRQHGGQADLPKLDRIEVTRPDTGYRATAFIVGTNGWNQFTLAEVLAQQWGLISNRKSGNWNRQSEFAMNIWSGNPLRFPDLARIKVHSPEKNSAGRMTVNVDLTIRDEKTGGFRNYLLRPGDVVEVPEADRPVDESWKGLVQPDFIALSNVLARTVSITLSGKTTSFTIAPSMAYMMAGSGRVNLVVPSPMLRSVLDESKLIRSSSDLTRVKVTRRESANAKPRVWIVDCSIPDKAPDLWLRDGDVIEVPEK